MLAPQEKSSRHSTLTKEIMMDYFRKLEQIDKHLADHPKDYQAVIARLKTYSDAVEHGLYLRRIERLKKVEKYRRTYGSE